jgi:hypothetical protein
VKRDHPPIEWLTDYTSRLENRHLVVEYLALDVKLP